MAFSLPLVSTKWRGIPQLVGESGAAFLCDINAPEEYAEALSELLENPMKREKMGSLARKYYEAHYTREIFLRRMGDAIKGVLNEA